MADESIAVFYTLTEPQINNIIHTLRTGIFQAERNITMLEARQPLANSDKMFIQDLDEKIKHANGMIHLLNKRLFELEAYNGIEDPRERQNDQAA